MTAIYIPDLPLTEEQRTQLLADIQTTIAAAQPIYQDNIDMWSAIAALVYFLNNPIVPPPSDPPPESP
jgi:hypothetical protein